MSLLMMLIIVFFSREIPDSLLIISNKNNLATGTYASVTNKQHVYELFFDFSVSSISGLIFI